MPSCHAVRSPAIDAIDAVRSPTTRNYGCLRRAKTLGTMLQAAGYFTGFVGKVNMARTHGQAHPNPPTLYLGHAPSAPLLACSDAISCQPSPYQSSPFRLFLTQASPSYFAASKPLPSHHHIQSSLTPILNDAFLMAVAHLHFLARVI